MGQHALRRMGADEFLDWDINQPDARHELIDGVPRAMTGAQRRHDLIITNGMRELGNRLLDGPCVPFTADIALRMSNGNVRRPDIGVDCGPIPDAFTYSAAPRLLIEVLSPSTRPLDQARKLEEYKSIGSLVYILLVEQLASEVMLWSRGPGGTWQHITLSGLDAVIDLPALDISLPLSGLYHRVVFDDPP